LDFDYGALAQLQHFSINNLGDPFIESNYGVHSRQFEVGVLDWFARLWELEKDEYWGYITNCGTEGNLHGILVGLVLENGPVEFVICHSLLWNVDSVLNLLKKLFFTGERYSLMESCTPLVSLTIQYSKQQECTGWNVSRWTPIFLEKLIVLILRES
jgi:hypothetical protein